MLGYKKSHISFPEAWLTFRAQSAGAGQPSSPAFRAQLVNYPFRPFQWATNHPVTRLRIVLESAQNQCKLSPENEAPASRKKPLDENIPRRNS